MAPRRASPLLLLIFLLLARALFCALLSLYVHLLYILKTSFIFLSFILVHLFKYIFYLFQRRRRASSPLLLIFLRHMRARFALRQRALAALRARISCISSWGIFSRAARAPRAASFEKACTSSALLLASCIFLHISSLLYKHISSIARWMRVAGLLRPQYLRRHHDHRSAPLKPENLLGALSRRVSWSNIRINAGLGHCCNLLYR